MGKYDERVLARLAGTLLNLDFEIWKYLNWMHDFVWALN